MITTHHTTPMRKTAPERNLQNRKRTHRTLFGGIIIGLILYGCSTNDTIENKTTTAEETATPVAPTMQTHTPPPLPEATIRHSPHPAKHNERTREHSRFTAKAHKKNEKDIDGGFKIIIDSGSISKDLHISISTVEQTPETSNGLQLCSERWRLMPDGQQFSKPVELHIPYDETLLPYGSDISELKGYTYDEASRSWIEIEPEYIDITSKHVVIHTPHFSDYAAGILRSPENNEMTHHTPTRLSEQAPADPMSGIPIIAAPEADNSGRATIIYPLQLPAGRRGQQPLLNIQYNSGGSSSLLGYGWVLTTGEITIETRWGVPLYDPDYESESYLINGESIVSGKEDQDGNYILEVPTYHSDKQARQNERRYHRRVEGSFERIIRHGTHPTNYRWEVTDKSGTTYYYGRSSDNGNPHNSERRDQAGNINTWYLSRIEDPYGNSIDYRYGTHTDRTVGSPLKNGIQHYPEDIYYSGHGDTLGKYRIHIDIDSESRKERDASIDCRHGMKTIATCLIDKINIQYENRTIRSYHFGYTEGSYGKTLLCHIYESDSTLEGDISDTLNIYRRCPDNKEDKTSGDLAISSHRRKPEHRVLSHTFEYTQSNDTYSEPHEISTGDEDVNYLYLSNALTNALSNIEGSTGTSRSIGGSVNVGIGGNPSSKTLTAGGNYGRTWSTDRGVVTMVDLNGDGYPDKLYRSGEQLKYNLQQPLGEGEIRLKPFEASRDINSSIHNYQKQKTTSSHWGIEATVGGLRDVGKLNSASGNLQWGNSRTRISTYLIDIDGDGLPDIVDNGKLYLNRPDGKQPRYTDHTDSTTIHVGGSCGGTIKNDTEVNSELFRYTDLNGADECIKIEDTALCSQGYTPPQLYEPAIESVIAWAAPYAGTISISGEMHIDRTQRNLMQLHHITDPMQLHLQHHGNGTDRALSSYAISADTAYLQYHNQDSEPDQENYIYTNTDDNGDTGGYTINISHNNLHVQENDLICLRLQNNESRAFTTLNIDDLTIEYTDKPAIVDANGKQYNRYNYTEDYLCGTNTCDSIQISIGEKLLIQPRIITTSPLGEDLTLLVYSSRSNQAILSRTLPQGSTATATHPINRDTTIDIRSGDILWAELHSHNTAQEHIQADLTLSITQATGYDIIDTHTSSDTTYTISYHPTIKRTYKQRQLQPSPTWSPTATEENITFRPNINMNGRTLTITIKDEQGLVASRTLTSAQPSLTLTRAEAGKHYHIDYHSDRPISTPISTDIYKNGTKKYESVASGYYTDYTRDDLRKYPGKYRGWSRFGYKSSDGASTINTTLLNEYDTAADTYPEITEQSDFGQAPMLEGPEASNPHFYNPLSGAFYPASPESDQSWSIYGSNSRISKHTIDNNHNQDPDEEADEHYDDTYLSPIPYTYANPKPKVITKESYTEPDVTYNVNMNFFEISIGASRNEGTQRVTADMTDMNGDGYPDIISGDRIQYSKPQGGLSDNIRYHMQNNTETDRSHYTTINGSSSGGNYINIEQQPSNSPRNGNINMSGNSGVSGSTSEGNSRLIDINGDGLPDKVKDDSTVYLNYGYSFGPEIKWKNSSLHSSSSNSMTTSLSSSSTEFNLNNGSISGGVSIQMNENNTTRTHIDINGDGLPDILHIDGDDLYVQYNQGSRYTPAVLLCSNQKIEKSISLTSGVNGSFSIGFSLWIFKTVFNPHAGINHTINYSKVRWIDMNNDGYPDIVEEGSGGKIEVRYSMNGPVNLLKRINGPAGHTMEIDYTLSGSSTDSPRRYYNMSRVIVKNRHPHDSLHIEKRYTYKSRYYDRYEREDHGYSEVTTTEYNNGSPYRISTTCYHTKDILYKGLPYKTTITDTSGRKLRESSYTYAKKELTSGTIVPEDMAWCYGGTYPAIHEERHSSYEQGDTTDSLSTVTEYHHTSHGNISEVIEYSQGQNDLLHTTLHYQTDTLRHILNTVNQVTVSDQGGNPLRHRRAYYNTRGDISTLTLHNGSQTHRYDYNYDSYGNLTDLYYPTNAGGQRNSIHNSYDTATHSRIVVQKDAMGYTSRSRYNPLWQQYDETTDISGNSIQYKYDVRGRLESLHLFGETSPAISYEYSDLQELSTGAVADDWRTLNNSPWVRTTYHDRNGQRQRIDISDAIGRHIQQKQDKSVEGQKQRVTSGRIMTDNLGRPVRTYHPYIESSTHPDSLYNPCTGSNPTDYRYDTKDRTIHISLPDGSTETNTFAIHNSPYPQAHHTHTDRNGNTSTITTDAKGRRTQIVQYTNNNSFITHYDYDLLSQPTAITDPEGNTTTYEYDRIGRVIHIDRPDQGITKTSYDPAGHIIDIETSQGEHISYKYNYDQLTSKTYSERYWNDSHYEYGSPTDGNASGRVIKIQDASGIKERKYDRMGNIDHERHTIVQPYSSYTINLETLWNYDIWGRINTIEYPDGEKVTYDYDQGGGLTSIIGDKHGRITKYLTDIHYDHYGNRIHEIQGNDVETHYIYDPVTLRLKQMTNLSHQSGAVLQDNHYSYDRNGNLTNMEDHGQNRRTQYYEYDALNRLTYSKGNIDNQGTELWYESHYNYTANGKMQQKQTHSRKLNNTLGIHDIHTAYRYNYNNDQPNTIESIYDEESGLSKYYKWDGKGNMTDRYDEQNKTNTKMCWTEDNRMQAYVQMNEGTDKGRAAYYGYNTSGERYVRYIGTTINITQNGITFHRPVLQSPVLYANSLITLNGKGYTKHYFEGDRRVCSKIGGGFTGRTEDDINDRIQPIEGEYEELFERQYTGIKETFANCIGTDMEHNLKYDPYKTIMENELGRDEDEPAFYYHGDHLGSSAYLTDDAGAITQTLNYLPYGEDWVDVHNSPNYLSRYKYNGKEKDPESGLHYYGARYYDSDISQWLSIDPMADKYPSLSPYNYCADNPVILVDLDGRDFDQESKDQYISPYRDEINARLERIKGLKDWENHYKKQHDEYQNILKELKALEDDPNNLYVIRQDRKLDYGVQGKLEFAGMDNGKRKINIYINPDRRGVCSFLDPLAHELKHAYQYYEGRLGFAYKRGGSYDSNNCQRFEMEAGERGQIFSGKNIECHNKFELNKSDDFKLDPYYEKFSEEPRFKREDGGVFNTPNK